MKISLHQLSRNACMAIAAGATTLAVIASSASTGIASPSYAQFTHSTSLSQVPAKYLVGGQFDKTANSKEKTSTMWARVPPKLAGKWKLIKTSDSFTDTFDVDHTKSEGLPVLDKRAAEIIIGLREAENKTIWDSENLNTSKIGDPTKVNIIQRWALNYGSDRSMSLMIERLNLDCGTKGDTIKKTYLSETIADFDLLADDKLQVKISTKWFSPEGEPLADAHLTREYKRTAPFKDVATLNGTDLKSAFESRNARSH